MKYLLPCFFSVLLCLWSLNTSAAPGDLDGSFGVGGKVLMTMGICTHSEGLSVVSVPCNAGVGSVIQQQDGKLLAAGHIYSTDFIELGHPTVYSQYSIALARYSSSGALDSSFGNAGVVLTPVSNYGSGVYSVIQQHDEKLLVAGGSSSANSDFILVRYSSDGSLDNSFNGSGIVVTDFGSNEAARSIIRQHDGKLLVSGLSSNGFVLARYHHDGALDTSFGTGGKVVLQVGMTSDESAYSVVQQTDGQLVVAGGGVNILYVVRLNLDGSLDSSFGGFGNVFPGGQPGIVVISNGNARKIVQIEGGKLLLSGTVDDDFALVRLNPDGSLDATFNGSGIVTTDFNQTRSVGNDLIVQADGKLVVAGYSGGYGAYTFSLARYNADGSLDITFGIAGKLNIAVGAGFDYAYSLIEQRDGKLVLAGSSRNGNYNEFALVRIESGQPDSDGDGFIDGIDTFPAYASEWLDDDHDGIGNNADTDDDDDGIPDGLDPQLEWIPLSINAVYKGSTIKDSVAPL